MDFDQIVDQADEQAAADLVSQARERILPIVEGITGAKYEEGDIKHLMDQAGISETIARLSDIACSIWHIVEGDYEVMDADRWYEWEELGLEVSEWYKKSLAIENAQWMLR